MIVLFMLIKFVGESRTSRLKLHMKSVAKCSVVLGLLCERNFSRICGIEFWEISKFGRLGEKGHPILVYRIPVGAKSLFPAPNNH